MNAKLPITITEDLQNNLFIPTQPLTFETHKN